MAIVFLSGKDTFRLNNKYKALLNEYNIQKDSLSIFDGSDKKSFSLERALLECGTISLFEEENNRCVVIKNPYFLDPSAKVTKDEEKEKDKRVALLKDYLLEPNESTLLIFICDEFDADKRKSEYKLFNVNNSKVFQFDVMKSWEFENYVKQVLKDNKLEMDNEALYEFIHRVNNNSLLLHNEIEKLVLFGEKKIDIDIVKKLVALNPDINVFEICNAFISGDISRTLSAYDDMLKANFDVTAIFNMLASRLRAFFEAKRLQENGCTEEEITTRLHANAYAIKKSLENTYMISSSEILAYLNELAEIDQAVKLGKKDMKESLEMFLIRNGNTYGRN